MKAITVWQPWATLIAVGAKPFEFRQWAAPKSIVGQRIAIAAGARPARQSEINRIIEQGPVESGLTLEAIEILESCPAHFFMTSHVFCTVILGEPKLASQLIKDGVLKADSDRVDHHIWGWPMLSVERVEPPVPVKGAKDLGVDAMNVLDLAELKSAPGADLLGEVLDGIANEASRIGTMGDALIKTGQITQLPESRQISLRCLLAGAAVIEALLRDGEADKAAKRKPDAVVMKAIEHARSSLIIAATRGMKDAPRSPLEGDGNA